MGNQDKFLDKRFKVNQEKIDQEFWKLFDETGEVPSVKQLTNSTGLAFKTIYNHYETQYVGDITSKWKIHMDRAMAALCIKAEKGDIQAIQLLAKLTGFIEKKKTEIEVKDKTVKVEFTDKK